MARSLPPLPPGQQPIPSAGQRRRQSRRIKSRRCLAGDEPVLSGQLACDPPCCRMGTCRSRPCSAPGPGGATGRRQARAHYAARRHVSQPGPAIGLRREAGNCTRHRIRRCQHVAPGEQRGRPPVALQAETSGEPGSAPTRIDQLTGRDRSNRALQEETHSTIGFEPGCVDAQADRRAGPSRRGAQFPV